MKLALLKKNRISIGEVKYGPMSDTTNMLSITCDKRIIRTSLVVIDSTAKVIGIQQKVNSERWN
jgi:hypothetical protein